MQVAVIQLSSTVDQERNMRVAQALLEKAALAGNQLVVLPELFGCLGPGDSATHNAQELTGPLASWASVMAQRYGIFLVAGSISLKHQDKTANTSLVYSPQGQLLTAYRKIHLFDCDVPGAAYRESQYVVPGEQPVTCPITPECTLGLSICYDLRFPELFRILALQGANVITLPAAFTEKTGRDHWEILLRARAIENQAFVLAADQVGAPGKGLRRFGRSMIVDPWGIILAQAPDRECYISADLDFSQQAKYRRELPALANRQPQAYHWPQTEPSNIK